jgi:hypothetical protein
MTLPNVDPANGQQNAWVQDWLTAWAIKYIGEPAPTDAPIGDSWDDWQTHERAVEMIQGTYSPKAGEVRLVIDVGHGEYPFAGDGVTTYTLHEPFGLADLPDEDAAAQMLARTLEHEGITDFEAYDPSWSIVIDARGTFDALDAAYGALRDDVSGVPSGDDTTFDYWPSGARALMQVAAALDALDGGERRAESVRVVKDVLDALGDTADEVRDRVGLPEQEER